MSTSINASLGIMNDGWGVCGFTSTFYAMHHRNPGTRPWLINATQAYSVLYEIADYLESIKGTALEADITNFTRSFGPDYATFSFATYIQRINDSSSKLKESDAIKDDVLFGIAMPPHAVVDYITRAWKWKASVTELTQPTQITDAIVGVTENWSAGKPYHGLCHYLYRGKHKYYSWGKEFGSLREAMPNASMCYAITVSPP
ncbi:MAG: hypothetical protein NVSMB18_23180 [Acetobacteraceae bacterium]